VVARQAVELTANRGVNAIDTEKRIVFISDADSTSGRAIASTMARDGFGVVLNSKSDGNELHETLNALYRKDVPALVTNSALRTTADVEAIQSQIADTFGRLDVIVHNQNRVERLSIETCPIDTAIDVLDENVKTAFLCAQVLGKYVADCGGGSVVFVGSIHDEKPTGSAFLYSISKGAIQMLCREAALELGRMNVRVNVIEMGPVDGDEVRFESELSDIYIDYQSKVPSATLTTMDDLAEMVSFLVSSRAKHLNGTDIRIDGGFTLHYLDHKMKRG
jgi:glucose 1-dehydrogenase